MARPWANVSFVGIIIEFNEMLPTVRLTLLTSEYFMLNILSLQLYRFFGSAVLECQRLARLPKITTVDHDTFTG